MLIRHLLRPLYRGPVWFFFLFLITAMKRYSRPLRYYFRVAIIFYQYSAGITRSLVSTAAVVVSFNSGLACRHLNVIFPYRRRSLSTPFALVRDILF